MKEFWDIITAWTCSIKFLRYPNFKFYECIFSKSNAFVVVSWVEVWFSWWRHQMETFPVLLAICAGNSPVTGEFPSQRPATRSFDVFFDLGLNKRLSKQSSRWSFETPSCSLWRHYNGSQNTQWSQCRFNIIANNIHDPDLNWLYEAFALCQTKHAWVRYKKHNNPKYNFIRRIITTYAEGDQQHITYSTAV